MKFIGDGIGGSLVMHQYSDEEMNSFKKYPIVNVSSADELTLFGVYSLNLTNAWYGEDDTFFLYLSYFMGVFNAVPDYLNLLLLDNSNSFVPMPNEIRERIFVKTVNATFRDYQNTLQNNILYMGTFGKFITQKSEMNTYVNISYPQVVNYEMDTSLNQTLDVYYYNFYGSIPIGNPLRYKMVAVTDQINYPNPSYISLYKFNVIGSENQKLDYNGYGLRNYVFYFDADKLLDYYSKQFNETLQIETLACGYQKERTNSYVDNGRSKVNLKEGTLTCDDTIGNDVKSVTIMVKTIKTISSSTPHQSSGKIPVDESTIIVAVTASAFGALLIVVGIITIVAMICCLRRNKKYSEIQ
ncbi:predicted protein [Naegleria gruberi]|uniref:Predicted protein n=1 Tax=Naegleria gruberi TaxID=5762 RepID=D2VJP8_NAEGR|nr:uncharacterized protein NAEGRDRAFT_50104 [Naegleria gruberi]EFC43068.1 predicted protein [Naegleria gruberi]|eukprot:XP_002675812.1 predicted protein [Naegleria gruberi strain NEG-M]